MHAYVNNQTLSAGTGDDSFNFHSTGGGKVIYEGGDDTLVYFNNVSGTGSEKRVDRRSLGGELQRRCTCPSRAPTC